MSHCTQRHILCSGGSQAAPPHPTHLPPAHLCVGVQPGWIHLWFEPFLPLLLSSFLLRAKSALQFSALNHTDIGQGIICADPTFPVAFSCSAFLSFIFVISGQIRQTSFSAMKHFPTHIPQHCPAGRFILVQPSP